jgi:hypothetical protein
MTPIQPAAILNSLQAGFLADLVVRLCVHSINGISSRYGGSARLLLVFAGVIGGLLAFGLIGIFIGPVVLAVADKLLMAWIDSRAYDAASEVPRE